MDDRQQATQQQGAVGELHDARRKSAAREWTEAILVAVALALVIRTFVVQAFKIPSGSMLESLQIGDHLLVNKMTRGTIVEVPLTRIALFTVPRLGDPQRGEILVFQFPRDPSRDFIKRVIGLPGEVVAIRDKRVYIDGRLIEEPYVVYRGGPPAANPPPATLPARPGAVPACSAREGGYPRDRDDYGPCLVPEGHLFMMGDNRDQSEDSRAWGPLPMELIRGKAFLIYWSWNRDRFLPRWDRIGMLVR
ncbi:MAG: signal peptidase I [candidate division NC10 bacterium]|nr:signal peptidase I [candidate division NC10 bacterium]MBI3003043.1 signal peptidase I [candidate division NC10 bacterium]